MLKRFSKFIVTNPAKVAIVFTIVTCFLGFNLFYLEMDLRPQATYTTYEDNNELNNRFMKEFGSDDNWLILMITSRHIFTPTGMTLIQELTYKIAAIPELQNTKSLINIPEIRSIKGEGLEVVSFSDPLPETKADFQKLKKRAMINPLYKKIYISSDGNSTAVTTELAEDIEKVEQISHVVDKIKDIIAETSNKYPDFKIILSGFPYVTTDVTQSLKDDQKLLLPIVMIVLFILAYLSFHYIKGAIMPFVVVLVSMIWGLGILSLCGGGINVLTNTLPFLVMIIGIADSIHLMGRFDEEIKKGLTRKEAVYNSIYHIGIACFLTSFTTAIGFASLVISTNKLVNHFGIYASLAILAAFIVTIILLPLFLLRWGKSEPSSSVYKQRTDLIVHSLLERCAAITIRHRWFLFFVGLCIVVFSISGAMRAETSTSIFEFYKEDSTIFQNKLAIEESLGGVMMYEIGFAGEEGLFENPDFLNKVLDLQQKLQKDPIVSNVVSKTISLADFIKDMNKAFHDGEETENKIPPTSNAIAQLLLLFSMSDNEALNRFVSPDYSMGRILLWCKSIHSEVFLPQQTRVNELIQSIFPEKNINFQISLLGELIRGVRPLTNLMRDLVKSISIASVIIFFIIGIAFRSVRLSLISIIPNLIPILLTYGTMGWLGIKIQATTTLVFCVSLGIAVDDSLHFLARFREELKNHGDYEKAIRGAFHGAGKAILYTTIILVSGFMVFTLSSFPPIAMLGYLTAITLISALLADFFVLPACILIFKPKL